MKLVRTLITESVVEHSFSIRCLEESTLAMASYNRLAYHRIVFIACGQGLLEIDQTLYTLSSGQIYLMAKGQIYRFDNTHRVQGYSISFGDCFWDRTPKSTRNCKAVLFNNALVNQQLHLTDSEIDQFIPLLQGLYSDYRETHYLNQMDVWAAYLKIIMIKLANVHLTEKSPIDSQHYILYRQFMEMLSENFRSHHAVKTYADRLNTTPRKLSVACKLCSGSRAKELIRGQIVAEAKRLLQFSSMTVKEIGYELHFTTPEQFSHFFKKNVHTAPADYRNRFVL